MIKKRYILLELKVKWPMSANSETYNRTRNNLELENVLPNISLATSETERGYY